MLEKNASYQIVYTEQKKKEEHFYVSFLNPELLF